MADDSRGGLFKDDQTRRPGLDLLVQLAAEGRLPEEVRLQQFQQESASEGAAEPVPPLWKASEREISVL